MKNKSYRKIFIIACVLVVGLVLFFLLSDPLTLPSRLTGSITDHVQNKSLFTVSKLIDKHEDTSLDGNTGLDGVFQLKKSEVQQLLDAQQMLTCSSSESCQIEAPTVTGDNRCQNLVEDKNVHMKICVNMKSNQVYWWYSIT
jgi:hypothetical protein